MMNKNLMRNLSTHLLAAILGAIAVIVPMGVAFINDTDPVPSPPAMTQSYFLTQCAEDEVIGMVPGNFDGVECIHRDDLATPTSTPASPAPITSQGR